MARFATAVSGKTLGRWQGLADLRPADIRYRVRRTALAALAIASMVATLAATGATLSGRALSGVVSGNPGGTVSSVDPTGYGWESGIRAGQFVDVLLDSTEAGGWRIETHDASGRHLAIGPIVDADLQALLPLAFGGLLIAYLAIVFLRTHRRWVLPASAIAILVAAIPLKVHGAAIPSTVALSAAALVPAVAYSLRLPRWLGIRWITTAAVIALAVAWGALRLAGFEPDSPIKAAADTVAFWGTLALVVERAVLPSMSGRQLGVVRPGLFDVVVVAGLALAAVLIAAALQVPLLVTALAVLAIVAFVPGARHRLAQPIEDVLLGDVRAQAAADASEAERAKLARELHDVPLQELAAVIRRLEILPGAEAESEDLRALAGHLRNVATELRPPVLDDLGLPAALEFLAEEAGTPSMPVVAEIVDDTGFGAERRPPTEVELAMYRIASEAVGNAARHSGGSRVEIHARVSPDRVELAVTDDGAGLPPGAAREAARKKRLGLASMRRRAEGVDAELSIDGSSSGTTVRVVWQA
jgi:signal transduction histidine kinase